MSGADPHQRSSSSCPCCMLRSRCFWIYFFSDAFAALRAADLHPFCMCRVSCRRLRRAQLHLFAASRPSFLHICSLGPWLLLFSSLPPSWSSSGWRVEFSILVLSFSDFLCFRLICVIARSPHGAGRICRAQVPCALVVVYFAAL